MKRITKIAIGIGTALTLGLATVVSAHPHGYGPESGMGAGPGYGPGHGPGAGMGPGMGQGMGHGMGHMGGMGRMGHGMGPRGLGNPGAMADARIAYLKSELKIAPAQESAWTTFADQAKQRSEAMLALRTAAQGNTQATAPERLELRSQMMKKRLEQMEKSAAAFKELYAVLTPEQKALADQRVAMRGGRRMGFNR